MEETNISRDFSETGKPWEILKKYNSEIKRLKINY